MTDAHKVFSKTMVKAYKQKDTQTVLGCIKCSRCFIGVGFIYLTHISTNCSFFFL